MPVYRVHRLKPAPRQQFRWAPHTAGATDVRPRDYELEGEVEASSAYAAWAGLRGTGRALDVGDILETEDGKLFICKYVGFEEARWRAAVEPRSGQEVSAAPNPVI